MEKKKKKFSKIYDKNINSIYRFVFFKVNSEEITQDLCSETFLRAWKAFQKKGDSIQNPRAFLYQIARNLVIDHYREKDRTQFVSVDNVSLLDPKPGPEENALLRSDFEAVKAELDNLKDNYQNVIILRYVEGLAMPEIAKTMKKSEGATRVLLHRAMNSLRDRMNEKNKDGKIREA